MRRSSPVTRLSTLIVSLIIGSATLGAAALPGTDILVPAAARGLGNEGSLWVTSLYVAAADGEETNITVYWLVRNQANPSPIWSAITIPANGSIFYEDAIRDLFGLESGEGALRVVANRPVLVSSAILNLAGGTEFGQGFDGSPVTAATRAGGTSVIAGVIHGSSHRSNFFLIDATGAGSAATVDVIDGLGTVWATKQYTLGAWEPRLTSLDRFGDQTVVGGTIRITVTDGAVISGASRVNRASGDPVTLSSSWPVAELEGWAPDSMVGKSYQFMLFDPEGGFNESEVVFQTETSGTVTTPDNGEMELSYGSYQAIGDIATMAYTVTELDMVGIQLIMSWSAATSGFFAGTGEGPDGPQVVAGTFTEITPPSAAR